MTATGWDVVVPVKALAAAKSRLGEVGPALRRQLAFAMALDTVEAIAHCPVAVRVHVVSDVPSVATAVRAFDVEVTVHSGAPGGLNEALAFGAHRVRKARGTLGTVAVLGDLPALRREDLAVVLDQAGEFPRSTVADLEGSGCTLLAVRAGLSLRPRFGAGSFRRHVGGGAVPLEAPDGLRRDVDLVADLVDACRLGVGPRTAEVAGRIAETWLAVARPAERAGAAVMPALRTGRATLAPAERTALATVMSAERSALATVMSAERSALATGAAASALAAGPEPRRRSDQGAAATLTGDTARERFRRLDPISTMMAVGGYRPARGVGE